MHALDACVGNSLGPTIAGGDQIIIRDWHSVTAYLGFLGLLFVSLSITSESGQHTCRHCHSHHLESLNPLGEQGLRQHLEKLQATTKQSCKQHPVDCFPVHQDLSAQV